jgi:hypothetical protein
MRSSGKLKCEAFVGTQLSASLRSLSSAATTFAARCSSRRVEPHSQRPPRDRSASCRQARTLRRERAEIVADTPGPAVLVLADTYYPGWQAIVDGRGAPVLAANGLVRAAPLPEGGHVVEMRFARRWCWRGA